MIDLTKLFTNSLYKFMAFSGIFLFLFFLIAPEYMEYIWIEKSREINKLESKIVNNARNEELNIQAYKSKNNAIIAVINKSKNLQDTIGQVKLFIEETDKLVNRERNIIYNTNVFKFESEVLQKISTKQKQLKKIRSFGCGFSFIWLVMGISLWYFKIQRHIDIALKNNPDRFFENND